MKNITEVLDSVQMFFDLGFDLQDSFEAYLTSEQKVFLSMLRVIEPNLEQLASERSRFAIRPWMLLITRTPFASIVSSADGLSFGVGGVLGSCFPLMLHSILPFMPSLMKK